MPSEKTFADKLRDFPALKVGAILLGGLILVQFFAMLLANFFPSFAQFKLGPFFTLLMVLIAMGIPAVTIRRFYLGEKAGETFNRSDFLLIVIASGIALVGIFYLPKIVPQIFSIGFEQLFSVVAP